MVVDEVVVIDEPLRSLVLMPFPVGPDLLFVPVAGSFDFVDEDPFVDGCCLTRLLGETRLDCDCCAPFER